MANLFYFLVGWILLHAGAERLVRGGSRLALLAKRHVRRVLVLVAGGTLILAGVAMMVLPGPATVVIPLGLAVLGTEFLWARRLLRYIRREVERAASHVIGHGGEPPVDREE